MVLLDFSSAKIRERFLLLEELLISALWDPDPTRNSHDALALKALAPVVKAIERLSSGYTGKRMNLLSREDISEGDAVAYALYFGLVNAVKVMHLLSKLPLSTPLKKVADIGCGPGTASWALLLLEDPPEEITLADRSLSMLWVGERVLKALQERIRISPRFSCVESVTMVSNPSYDLVCLVNVLNELSPQEQLPFVKQSVSLLAPSGRLLVLEPGTPELTRPLMELRDALLREEPSLSIAYPCTRHSACPMLHEKTEWCHSYFTWDRPRLIRQLDELTGFNKHTLKYSALVFQKAPRYETSALRVIRAPLKNKQGTIVGLCGDAFYGDVLLRKRNRSPSNQALEKVRVHDKIGLVPRPLDGVITPECRVTGSDNAPSV